MSSGLLEEDRGICRFQTWHQFPGYLIQEDAPITTEQVKGILNYPIERRQLFRMGDNGQTEPVPAYCIIRTDTGRVLVSHVGVRFTPMNNVVLADAIESRLLRHNPELSVESVGTLFGGATAFINVVLERYRIKGDDSETLTRLLYYNPLGVGGYRVGVHNIRVQCANTLRMAKAQSEANKTLAVIPHTEGAATTIADKLFELSSILGASKDFRAGVESLVDMPVRNQQELDDLLKLLFPAPGDDEPENSTKQDVITLQHKLRERVGNIFNEGVDGIEPAYQRTRYSLLQACTYVVDHPDVIRAGNDLAFVVWDGIVGDRANNKEHFLTILLTK